MVSEKTRIDWCCLISQTGSEVVQVCERLGILPQQVITNKPGAISEKSWEFFRTNGINVVCIPEKPKWENYSKIQFNNLVTLHGYLRILPKQYFSLTCSWNTYNGHPGLITEFPELKGFNPQEKAFKSAHSLVGSVVHRVTEAVDEGEVLVITKAIIDPDTATLTDYYDVLKQRSIVAWDKFFTNYLAEPVS